MTTENEKKLWRSAQACLGGQGCLSVIMPAYRLADPIRHRTLMMAAADDARLILNRDPDLTSERGQAVQVLEALFDWRNDRTGLD